MNRILITGGTDGMGKELAMHFIKNGDEVIIVGSSFEKGNVFLKEARQLGAEKRAFFMQADLSLVRENRRIVEIMKDKYPSLDLVILAAASQKHRESITITEEGIEFVFGLMYLSRYILSYSLKELLEKSETPMIVNIAAPGMKGSVNWEDLQFKSNYDSEKVKFHSSRLNDLLGVRFAEKEEGCIKYVLFNPWAVRTKGALEAYDSAVKTLFTKMVYRVIGKDPAEAIKPVVYLWENQPDSLLSAYKEWKKVDLGMETFDEGNARRLDEMTVELL